MIIEEGYIHDRKTSVKVVSASHEVVDCSLADSTIVLRFLLDLLFHSNCSYIFDHLKQSSRTRLRLNLNPLQPSHRPIDEPRIDL
jgi:hypothetical protein